MISAVGISNCPSSSPHLSKRKFELSQQRVYISINRGSLSRGFGIGDEHSAATSGRLSHSLRCERCGMDKRQQSQPKHEYRRRCRCQLAGIKGNARDGMRCGAVSGKLEVIIREVEPRGSIVFDF